MRFSEREGEEQTFLKHKSFWLKRRFTVEVGAIVRVDGCHVGKEGCGGIDTVGAVNAGDVFEAADGDDQ